LKVEPIRSIEDLGVFEKKYEVINNSRSHLGTNDKKKPTNITRSKKKQMNK